MGKLLWQRAGTYLEAYQVLLGKLCTFSIELDGDGKLYRGDKNVNKVFGDKSQPTKAKTLNEAKAMCEQWHAEMWPKTLQWSSVEAEDLKHCVPESRIGIVTYFGKPCHWTNYEIALSSTLQVLGVSTRKYGQKLSVNLNPDNLSLTLEDAQQLCEQHYKENLNGT